MKMVRPSRRKGIEEVYGTKLEAMQTGRPQIVPHPGMTKTTTLRVASTRQTDARTQRSYVTANDYYITSNVPLNSTNMRTATSNVMTQASKPVQMPLQMQVASTQAVPYGSVSNRRLKPSARQPQKMHFVPQDNNMKNHSHLHVHGKNISMQGTQRNVYDMEPNLIDITEKDHIFTADNLNQRLAHGRMHPHAQPHPHAHPHPHPHPHQHPHPHPHPHPHSHPHQNPHPHPHPLQHQLHQQQQLNHPPNSSNVHTKHQQQQQNQQQQHQHQHQQHQQQQQRQGKRNVHPVTEDEGKDEDPEEFFELIRQTVRSAVGTTISEVVNRNFRDLSTKMERFSNELKMTNDHLGKLQNDVTSKVMHYGEENTRHFRYLCMKSEYDKMFYQHQAIRTGEQQQSSTKIQAASQANLNAVPAPSKVAKQKAAFNQKSVKQQLAAGKMYQSNFKKISKECAKAQNPCACHNTSKTPQQTEELQSSSEQSVNAKSSEVGVREVLGQIQRFCTQMQLNDLKDEQPKYNSMTGLSTVQMSDKPSSVSGPINTLNKGNSDAKPKNLSSAITVPTDHLDVEMETPVDSMDDIEIDNFQYSSDELSSYSDDSDVKFSGSATARAPLQSTRPTKLSMQHSNKGAGDGQ